MLLVIKCNQAETVSVDLSITTVYLCSAIAAGPNSTGPVLLNSLPCKGQIKFPWPVLKPIVVPLWVQADWTAVNDGALLPAAIRTNITPFEISESPIFWSRLPKSTLNKLPDPAGGVLGCTGVGSLPLPP